MKPPKLETINIEPVHIGGFTITHLEIDLMHVNHGINLKTGEYNAKTRSHFTKEEAALFFARLDGAFLEPESDKGNYLYFAQEIEIDRNKTYLIAFCIHKKESHSAGIITVYQVTRLTRRK